jgi:hypothetical protein
MEIEREDCHGDEAVMIGKKFGRLSVIKRSGSTPAKKKVWLCLCECGNEKRITTGDLNSGKIVSCGCYKNEKIAMLKFRHGQARAKNETREYISWKHMISRCFNKNNDAYKDYGERGITVCDRWLVFENFYDDMGEMPHRFSIERIDVNGNYEPSNCKWILKNRQATNKRTTVLSENDVREIRNLRKENLTMKDIGLRFGASAQLVYQVLSGKAWGWVK